MPKSILDDYTALPRVKPTAGYILIKPLEVEKKTAAGIVLPDTHDEKSQRGEVIKIGSPIYSDGREIHPECKEGDIVIYKKWGGDEVKFGVSGQEYIFVKFEDILAVIK
jgi:chaperonin GroES